MSSSIVKEGGGSKAKVPESRRQEHAASIDVLPNEVLLEIFDSWRHLILDGEYRAFISDVLTQEDWWVLSTVCRRWRQILLGSISRLRLCLHCDGFSLKRILNFPSSLPLLMAEIQANMDYDLHFAPPVFEHMDRALKIVLKGGDYILAKLCPELARSAPLLEYLAVETSTPGDVDAHLPAAFLNGNAPRLRCLRLDGIAIIDSPSFRAATARLVSLSVKLFQDFTVEHLLSVLSHLPMLRELEVGEAGFAQEELDWASDSLPAPLAIRATLPRLSKLHLKTMYRWIALIIPSIEASSVTDLSIRPFCSRNVTCQLPSLSHLLAPTGEASTVTAYFDLKHVKCTVALGPEVSQVTTRFIRSSDGHGRVLDVLAYALKALAGKVATVETLEFEGDLEVYKVVEGLEATPARWHKVLSLFSTVEELVFPVEPSFSTVARALSADIPAGVELLPSLRYITIDGPAKRKRGPSAEKIQEFAHAFTPFIEARKSAICPVQLCIDLEEQEAVV
ncbi:hypothetical protein BC834DRAFT_1034887 [Gloeopeniophorella convolvens]|nr:hypothetical protein BC834DRAFT_1034887 [Gloeopeniophorella convolvens]